MTITCTLCERPQMPVSKCDACQQEVNMELAKKVTKAKEVLKALHFKVIDVGLKAYIDKARQELDA